MQNLDVRGFSDWSLEVDSAQTALYIKKLYAKLIDVYFESASCIKPTGDGLLVVEAFQEDALIEVASRTIKNARRIVESFGSICSDEPMINFQVPSKVGIGIARGTASCLRTESRVLDYSGRVLNLASRLMDLARPQGLVVDEGFGLEHLEAELKDGFERHDVYLKGVSPNAPIGVCCWPPGVDIPAIHRNPLDEERWEHAELRTTRQKMEDADSRLYRFYLDPPPVPGTDVECEVAHQGLTPGKRKAQGRMTRFPFPVTEGEVGGAKVARIDQKALARRLKSKGVGPTWEIEIRISYRTA